MTPEEIETLIPAFSGFHQDFDLDDLTERDVLVWHARGLRPSKRELLFSALETLLAESETEEAFIAACWAAGAHFAPKRAELESFVTWARTPEGFAVIDAPGPTSTYIVVRADLSTT